MASSPPAAASAAPDNIKGVLWALLAAGLFSAVAAMAKIAVSEYHVLQILFFRQVVVFFSSLPPVVAAFPESLKTPRPGLHAVRLAGAFVALSCGIWAVAVLPLATATTLAFAQVFFVALLAMTFLGETVDRRRICAIGAGFAGVIVVMRPGAAGLIDPNALIPVAGAFGAAMAVTSVRKLSQTETTAALLVYQAVFVGVLAGAPLFWLWVTPDLGGLVLLFAMGVASSAGQWAGVQALRRGEASVVSNMEYVKLIYAAGLGYLLFAEVPDAYALAGAALIVISSAHVVHRESLNKRAS